ncbi:MAG TPA: hypothetical protein VL463_09550 [Kofleriaceae bacterium]|nr:hypothetical protein [Kofleriaceae bacterium]
MRILLASLVLLSAAAHADPVDTIGARVGGYGFRNPQATESRNAWDDCRMNGLGVFARKDVGFVNVEAGADIYFSESFPMAPNSDDAAEDRLSGIVTVAAGAKLVDTSRFRAMAQLGTGVELTHFKMTMPTGLEAEDSRALPVGFVGVTAEIKLGDKTAVGGALRTFVMGKFDANAACQLEVEPEAAAQGQFYLSYRL